MFERRLCRRNPDLGEASEGAVEALSEVQDSLDPPSFKYTITSKELTG